MVRGYAVDARTAMDIRPVTSVIEQTRVVAIWGRREGGGEGVIRFVLIYSTLLPPSTIETAIARSVYMRPGAAI